jgi:hypothetical protein
MTFSRLRVKLFFLTREQVVVRGGQIRRIWWVIKTMKAQVGQHLLSCKFPVNRSIVVLVKQRCAEGFNSVVKGLAN